jgi:hypothetical protein
VKERIAPPKAPSKPRAKRASCCMAGSRCSPIPGPQRSAWPISRARPLSSPVLISQTRRRQGGA